MLIEVGDQRNSYRKNFKEILLGIGSCSPFVRNGVTSSRHASVEVTVGSLSQMKEGRCRPDREEVETSLTNIADAFHVICQEYEKLVRVVPHVGKTQATSVITRMPILPFVKQEAKAESKQDPVEPPPSTIQEQTVASEEPRDTQAPTEVVEEETVEKEEDEPKVEITDEYFRKYILTGKGKDPEEKIDEACKEINYQN